MNEEYIQEHRVKAVDIVSSEQVNVEEAEMEGLSSKVCNKSVEADESVK